MTFDIAKYRKLRRAYHDALRLERDRFVFDCVELDTCYAKYVLELLEERLGVKS
jgi:hypothetical protein